MLDTESNQITVIVTMDTTVSGQNGTWTSDPQAKNATKDKIVLVRPDDAAAMVEALDAHISSVYRPITYKICEIAVGDFRTLAIGSADPDFHLGKGEMELMNRLENTRKIRPSLLIRLPFLRDDISEITASCVFRLYPENEGAKPARPGSSIYRLAIRPPEF